MRKSHPLPCVRGASRSEGWAGPFGQIFTLLGPLVDWDDPLSMFAKPLTGRIARVTVGSCAALFKIEISAVMHAARIVGVELLAELRLRLCKALRNGRS